MTARIREERYSAPCWRIRTLLRVFTYFPTEMQTNHPGQPTFSSTLRSNAEPIQTMWCAFAKLALHGLESCGGVITVPDTIWWLIWPWITEDTVCSPIMQECIGWFKTQKERMKGTFFWSVMGNVKSFKIGIYSQGFSLFEYSTECKCKSLSN